MLSQQKSSTIFDRSQIVFAEQYKWEVFPDEAVHAYLDDDVGWIEFVADPNDDDFFVGLNTDYWIVIIRKLAEESMIVSFLFDRVHSLLCNVDEWKRLMETKERCVPFDLIASPFAESEELIKHLQHNTLTLGFKSQDERGWHSRRFAVAFKRWVEAEMPLTKSVQDMLDHPHKEIEVGADNKKLHQDTDYDFESAVIAILEASPTEFARLRRMAKILQLTQGKEIKPKSIYHHFPEIKDKSTIRKDLKELSEMGLLS